MRILKPGRLPVAARYFIVQKASDTCQNIFTTADGTFPSDRCTSPAESSTQLSFQLHQGWCPHRRGRGNSRPVTPVCFIFKLPSLQEQLSGLRRRQPPLCSRLSPPNPSHAVLLRLALSLAQLTTAQQRVLLWRLNPTNCEFCSNHLCLESVSSSLGNCERPDHCWRLSRLCRTQYDILTLLTGVCKAISASRSVRETSRLHRFLVSGVKEAHGRLTCRTGGRLASQF